VKPTGEKAEIGVDGKVNHISNERIQRPNDNRYNTRKWIMKAEVTRRKWMKWNQTKTWLCTVLLI
jgi:hypothetical protein